MDERDRKDCTEALIKVALREAKALSVSLAEIIAYLQKGEHLAALGTFQGLEDRFRGLETVLKLARIP